MPTQCPDGAWCQVGAALPAPHAAPSLPPDSETGEDEASDPQVTARGELQDDATFSTPTGEWARGAGVGGIGLAGAVGAFPARCLLYRLRPGAGESDTLVDASVSTTPTSAPGLVPADERSSGSGSQQTVVERETDAGPPARGPYLRPGTHAPAPPPLPRQAHAPAPWGTGIRHLGVEPLVRASRADVAGAGWGSEDSLSVGSDPYGSAFSLYRGRALSLHV